MGKVEIDQYLKEHCVHLNQGTHEIKKPKDDLVYVVQRSALYLNHRDPVIENAVGEAISTRDSKNGCRGCDKYYGCSPRSTALVKSDSNSLDSTNNSI